MPHSDLEDGDTFYKVFSNSSDEFKSEIKDIYFGYPFEYEHDGVKKVFGNIKNANASQEQIKYLLKIQKEFGVPASLTMNEMNIPRELLVPGQPKLEFIKFVKSFYDAGIRVCTMSNTQLMSENILQKLMPDMRWKTTINHHIDSAQLVVDYVKLGYDTIILDRNLHRNMKELKQIRKAVDRLNKTRAKKVELSLLVDENCMDKCPFKDIHDAHFPSEKYITEGMSVTTCSKWRFLEDMPRKGMDAFWFTPSDFLEVKELVDDFKYTGRFSKISSFDKFTWNLRGVKYNSFQELLNSNEKRIEKASLFRNIPHQVKPEMEVLNKLLKNCRNQCWNCHKCEDTYGIEHFDSLIEL